MMPGKDGVSQIVEALATGLAQVSLTLGLSVVATVLGHFSGLTSWTTDAVWPTQGPDGLKAFSVVDGSNRNGIQLSSNTLMYQCFAYLSGSLGSPQASLGQRVTAWDSSYFDRAARRLPWARIPPNYLQEKGFRLTECHSGSTRCSRAPTPTPKALSDAWRPCPAPACPDCVGVSRRRSAPPVRGLRDGEST
jgi:hypothetical protein